MLFVQMKGMALLVTPKSMHVISSTVLRKDRLGTPCFNPSLSLELETYLKFGSSLFTCVCILDSLSLSVSVTVYGREYTILHNFPLP